MTTKASPIPKRNQNFVYTGKVFPDCKPGDIFLCTDIMPTPNQGLKYHGIRIEYRASGRPESGEVSRLYTSFFPDEIVSLDSDEGKVASCLLR